jgi:hypothetical protein
MPRGSINIPRRCANTGGARRNQPLRGEKVRIDGEALRKIALEERVLLLGLLHASNELNVLSKMILLATNTRTKGEIELAGKSLVGLVLIKTFAAKAVEAWALFRRAQNFPDFRDKYLRTDFADLKEVKDWLGSYFGKANLLTKVRDKFGAHYDYDQVAKGATNLARLNSFIFLTEPQGNSLYWFAEELQLRSLADLCNPGGTLRATYDQLLTDVIDVVSRLTRMTQLIAVIALQESGNAKRVRLSLSHTVRMRRSDSADLPFFINFDVQYGRKRKK